MHIHNGIDAIKLFFRKDKALYRSFFQILGFYPRNIQYYREALMHASLHAKGENGATINNERLEYLGDAVLETVVSDLLYQRFPNKREGFLTNARSKMVQRETLGKVAKEIGLDKLIQHQGSKAPSHAHNSYMAGNAFEALIGAIYLDRGFDHCMYFIRNRVIGVVLDMDKTAYVDVNFKSRLLELCQKNRLQLEYQLISETRDANGAPYFQSSTSVNGRVLGEGKGYSKRESQQMASKTALKQLKAHPEIIAELQSQTQTDTPESNKEEHKEEETR